MMSRINLIKHLHMPGYISAMQVWHPNYAEKENTAEVEVLKGNDSIMQFLNYLEVKAQENMNCFDLYAHQPINTYVHV